MEKTQQIATMLMSNRICGTNQLIVVHEALRQAHCAVSIDAHRAADWQAGPEHDSIEIITLPADVLMNGAVVIGTGEWRDKINIAGTTSLQEAAPGNFDNDVHNWRWRVLQR